MLQTYFQWFDDTLLILVNYIVKICIFDKIMFNIGVLNFDMYHDVMQFDYDNKK